MSQVQQQQPVEELYPNPITSRTNSPHSNGSFGPVFIVLAIIVVISAVACVLGRLCNRRLNRVKEVGQHHQPKPKLNKQQQSSHGLGPKEWESRQKPSFDVRDGDIEFGFETKRIPSIKNGGGKVRPTNPSGGGGHKPEVRFANNV